MHVAMVFVRCFGCCLQIVVQVWDWDQFTDHDLLGTVRIPMTEVFRVLPDKADDIHYFPLPKWYTLTPPDDVDNEVEEAHLGTELASVAKPAILMLAQLVFVEDMIPAPIPIPSIVPPMRDAWIEVVVFGLRDLTPRHLHPIVNPHVRLCWAAVVFLKGKGASGLHCVSSGLLACVLGLDVAARDFH